MHVVSSNASIVGVQQTRVLFLLISTWIWVHSEFKADSVEKMLSSLAFDSS